MTRLLFCFFVQFLISNVAFAQPNCNAFLWKGDTAQYKACKILVDNQQKYYQFSSAFHQLIDSAIAICPHFAYAYREKAAPYVKSGNFVEWKKYIDLAVQFDTLAYLPVRASLRYKFFADYIGTIQDIELLENKNKFDIGSSSNGTYHLTIVKALCYKQLGNYKKGILVLEHFMKQKNYSSGLYDNLHLGCMYYDIQDYSNAIIALERQVQRNEISEAHYYLAQSYKKLGNETAYLKAKQMAAQLYKENKKMFDEYNFMIDQIFKTDIEKL